MLYFSQKKRNNFLTKSFFEKFALLEEEKNASIEKSMRKQSCLEM